MPLLKDRVSFPSYPFNSMPTRSLQQQGPQTKQLLSYCSERLVAPEETGQDTVGSVAMFDTLRERVCAKKHDSVSLIMDSSFPLPLAS